MKLKPLTQQETARGIIATSYRVWLALEKMMTEKQKEAKVESTGLSVWDPSGRCVLSFRVPVELKERARQAAQKRACTLSIWTYRVIRKAAGMAEKEKLLRPAIGRAARKEHRTQNNWVYLAILRAVEAEGVE